MPKTIYTGRKRTILGTRPYKNYSPEILQLAVGMVKNKQISSYEAEKQFSIPRRTMEKKVHNQHSDKPGPKYRFNEDEETKFVNVLVTVADYGFPLTALDFRMVVYDYLKQNNKEHIFNDKPPGEFWLRSFLERHKNRLSLRSTQNIKSVRVEKTIDEFKNYFDNLKKSLEGVPVSNILNYDETNVNDDPGSQKCIFKRGVKYPERITNYTKGCISLIFAATADGKTLPPYVIYKADNLWTQWCQDGPPDVRYNRTKSGWLNSATFLDWFINIVLPWAKKLQGPKIIIGDNLSSHINVEVLELCQQNVIRFILLPSNTTHLTQPLDVAFFGPVKKVWRKILLQYKIENPSQSSLNKTHFPILLKKLLQEIGFRVEQNIKSGFGATGIHPFNPQKVLKRLPDYVDEINHGVDEILLNYLREKRRPNPLKRGPNKKLSVPPGTSISTSDIIVTKSLDSSNSNFTKQKRKKRNEQENKKEIVLESRSFGNNEIEEKNKSSKQQKKHDKENVLAECSIQQYEMFDEQYLLPNKCAEFDILAEENQQLCVEMSQDEMLAVEITQCNKTNEANITNNIQRSVLKRVENNYGGGQNTKIENDLTKVRQHNINKSYKGVTLLSEVKGTLQNQCFSGLKCGPFNLKKIDKDFDLFSARKEVMKSPDASNSDALDKKQNKGMYIKKEKKSRVIEKEKKKERTKNEIVAKNRIDLGKKHCDPDLTKYGEIGMNIYAASSCKEPEQILTDYVTNDYILVRYLLKNRVDYYVGKIITKLNEEYEVSFFKKIGRSDSTMFYVPKVKDLDKVNEQMIVKKVELLSMNEEETRFTFLNDEDYLYFA